MALSFTAVIAFTTAISAVGNKSLDEATVGLFGSLLMSKSVKSQALNKLIKPVVSAIFDMYFNFISIYDFWLAY